jgi:hypothetical protein
MLGGDGPNEVRGLPRTPCNAVQEPSGRVSCVSPVGGPSTPVQPPSTNSVLPLT